MVNEALLVGLGLVVASGFTVIYTAALVRNIRARRRGSKSVTRLRCPSCGYVLVRGFAEGDYVGRVVDMRCPRCGSRLVVDAIYVEQLASIASMLYVKRRGEEKKGQRKT